MAEKTAVYPGTFDPMTRGHFDLITRAAGLYDRLIVAVAATSAKTGALYDAAHRLAMIREDVEGAGLRNVTVEVLDTLLVDFCRRLAPEIETLFMMPSENLAYVTASTVREIARYGGDTSTFVTPAVQKRLAALAHPKV